MKTRPGYASALAYDFDAAGFGCVLGTIAGDDTIFVALREGVSREEVIDTFASAIPGLRHLVDPSKK